jgi:chromosome partitioning protein
MKKIKIVAIWNPKGGQGKSTFAINLAAAAVQMGLKPLVICQDQQGTSTLFYKAGNLPFEVVGEVPRERPNADIVFFDYQASDWALPDANLIVMPLLPKRAQYATYMDAYARAEAAGKEIITIVTDGQQHRAGEKETTEYLKGQGAFVVPSSGVFSRAESEYKTIFDESLNKVYKVADRRRELMQILGKILIDDSHIEIEEVRQEVAEYV